MTPDEAARVLRTGHARIDEPVEVLVAEATKWKREAEKWKAAYQELLDSRAGSGRAGKKRGSPPTQRRPLGRSEMSEPTIEMSRSWYFRLTKEREALLARVEELVAAANQLLEALDNWPQSWAHVADEAEALQEVLEASDAG